MASAKPIKSSKDKPPVISSDVPTVKGKPTAAVLSSPRAAISDSSKQEPTKKSAAVVKSTPKPAPIKVKQGAKTANKLPPPKTGVYVGCAIW
jgi:hypothetical protein